MEHKEIPMEQLVQLLQLQMDRGGAAALTVTGCSMLPMLRENRDTVFLSLPSQPFNKGDIILYRRENGQYVLHRIVSVSHSEIICCGDNQWQTERIEKAQVIAVVSAFSKNGSRYELDHTLYRLYVWLWVGLFPLRRPYIALRRRLGCLRRRLNRYNRF